MRLTKLLLELARVRFVSGGRQLVVNGQAHVVSLALIVQYSGQSVTHQVALTEGFSNSSRSLDWGIS